MTVFHAVRQYHMLFRDMPELTRNTLSRKLNDVLTEVKLWKLNFVRQITGIRYDVRLDFRDEHRVVPELFVTHIRLSVAIMNM